MYSGKIAVPPGGGGIVKSLELSVAMRNLWCLEKISILPFIISATGIVPQSFRLREHIGG
jgi:hypothetical protein